VAFCVEHAPVPSKRCVECEVNFYAEKRARTGGFLTVTMLGILLFWIGKVEELPHRGAITTGRVDFTILCIIGALLVAGVIVTGPRVLQRRRFLSERIIPKCELPKAVVVADSDDN
jgi:hypothetical protein